MRQGPAMARDLGPSGLQTRAEGSLLSVPNPYPG